MVWSDFGGVLTPPIEGSLDAFCDRWRIDRENLARAMTTVGHRYGVRDPLAPIDTPLVSEQDWLAQVSQELGGALPLTTLADDWFRDRPTNPEWLAALHRLRRRGAQVGLLSNMVPTWDAHWRRMVDVPGTFDFVALSFEIDARKPDREAFVAAQRLANADADLCILVDDLEENCAGALAAGWHAVHFTSAADAARQVAQIVERRLSSGSTRPL